MREIKRHDIVQVNERHDWVGCFVYVTEVKSWGVQGFVQVPNQGQAFIRLKHEEYEKVGRAELQIGDED